MILNNFITMKHIVQHKNQSVTPNRILALHQLIIKEHLTKKLKKVNSEIQMMFMW